MQNEHFQTAYEDRESDEFKEWLFFLYQAHSKVAAIVDAAMSEQRERFEEDNNA